MKDDIIYNPYVLSIYLQNVKCFGQRQSLSLSHSGNPFMWTMILGDNGTGKSTILKSIAACLLSEEEVFHYIQPKDYIKNGEKKSIIEIKMFDRKLGVAQDTNSINVDSNTKLNIKKPRTYRLKIPAFGYGSYRKYSKKNYLSKNDLSSSFSSLFDENIELINAEEWLLKSDYRDSKLSNGNSDFLKVKKIILQILKNEVYDIEIREVDFDFRVLFKTRYGWVSIDQLSTGYKSLVTWMVDLASRLMETYPDSEDPLSEKALVLVDEIDLHLHVRVQKSIVQFLRDIFPNVQFIVTAHSPLMVLSAENSNIILLKKEENFVKIENNPVDIKNWRIDQVLTSDLFGLDSARSEKTENKLKRRVDLLVKGDLNMNEKEEISKLNKFAKKIPFSEKTNLDKAEALIMRTAEKLKRLEDDQN